jgi:nicotinamidase-related amidase
MRNEAVSTTDWAAHRARMSEDLRLDPARTVALTIDMQRAYLDPSLGTKCLPPDEAAAVVAAPAGLLDCCRSLGIPVIHAYVNRLPIEHHARVGSSRFATISKDLLTRGKAQTLDRPIGSPEAEVMADLVRDDDIHVRSKKTTDSYYGTELPILLEQAIKPDTVLIMGINTETCVYAGTFGTKVRGYRPVVVTDGVGSHRDPDNTRLALELMSRTIAWTLPSGEIATRLQAG